MKRIVSWLMLSIMLLSNTGVFAAANDSDSYNEKLYSDVCKLINSLNAGVSLEENSIDTDITRMELVKNSVKILNKGVSLDYNQGVLSVTDVNDEDMGYLEYAAHGGLISYSDQQFHPEERADFDFAKKAILSLVSFYSDNTKNTALIHDLERGLRRSAYSDFKAGDAYVMIYNLLMSDTPYPMLEDSPIMEGLYHLKKAKVRIVADSGSSYTGYVPVDGRIKAEFGNGQVVDFAYAGDTKDILGRYAYLYYNAEDDSAAFITPADESDIVAEFNEKQYIDFDSSSRTIYWKEYQSNSRWETNYKEKKKTVLKDADVIFNGVFVTNHNFVYDILANHTYNIDKIQLISTGKNSKIDLIKIDAYTTAYVSSVNGEDHTIRDKTGNIIKLDPNEQVESFNVKTADDNSIQFSDIASNSIVSIFAIQSEKQRVDMKVSTSVTEGTVSSLNKDGNRSYIMADGIEYQLSNSLADSVDSIKLGTNYILHLDHNGLVAGFEIGTLGTENIGGVVSMSFDEGTNIFQLQIYTLKGELKAFETRVKFRVNSRKATINDNGTVTVMNEKDETETMSIRDFKKYMFKGLIQYKLDGDGRIANLILPRQNAKQGDLGYTKGMNNPDIASLTPSAGVLRYKSNDKMFIPDEGGRDSMNFVAVTDSTQVIKIPPADFNASRENYYSIGQMSEFKNDNQATVIGYSLAGENAVTADILAVVQNSSTDPSQSGYYIVDKKGTAVNKNEEIGAILCCINAITGAEEEFTTESLQFAEYDTTSKALTGKYIDIDEGDIIQVGLNGYGDASAFILTYDCSSGEVVEKNAGYWYGETRLVRGSVYSVSEKHFTYIDKESIDSESDIEGNLQVGSCKTLISVEPDTRRGGYNIKIGTASGLVGYREDQQKYSRVIYVTRYGETRACVEYK